MLFEQYRKFPLNFQHEKYIIIIMILMWLNHINIIKKISSYFTYLLRKLENPETLGSKRSNNCSPSRPSEAMYWHKQRQYKTFSHISFSFGMTNLKKNNWLLYCHTCIRCTINCKYIYFSKHYNYLKVNCKASHMTIFQIEQCFLKGFFNFKTIKNILGSSFCFIWKPM